MRLFKEETYQLPAEELSLVTEDSKRVVEVQQLPDAAPPARRTRLCRSARRRPPAGSCLRPRRLPLPLWSVWAAATLSIRFGESAVR